MAEGSRREVRSPRDAFGDGFAEAVRTQFAAKVGCDIGSFGQLCVDGLLQSGGGFDQIGSFVAFAQPID